jgi:hypothetical protein
VKVDGLAEALSASEASGCAFEVLDDGIDASVNVGTATVSPSRPCGAGQARGQLMGPSRGGVPVVVRGRESRSHGEGGQQECRSYWKEEIWR